MKLTFPNVPVEALQELAQEVRGFGASVFFEPSGTRGHVRFPAGALQFDHADDTFTVVILQSNGFPDRLLKGGCRQLVEEACERLRQRIEA